jgi:hypothetical protein
MVRGMLFRPKVDVLPNKQLVLRFLACFVLAGCELKATEPLTVEIGRDRQEQIVGDFDLVSVNSFSKRAGHTTTAQFVQFHKRSVARGTVSGCTYTLVGIDRALTAHHCLVGGPTEGEQLEFHDEDPGPLANPLPRELVPVNQIVADFWPTDVVMVSTAGFPALRHDISRLSETDVLGLGTIIAHPELVQTGNNQKVVGVGSYVQDLLPGGWAHTIDTEGGSSGAALLNVDGRIAGVHSGSVHQPLMNVAMKTGQFRSGVRAALGGVEDILVKSTSSDAQFVVRGGRAFPLASPSQAQQLGLRNSDLREFATNTGIDNALLLAQVRRIADGLLLQALDGARYVTVGGAPFRFSDPSEFFLLGFSEGMVRMVPSVESLPVTPSVGLAVRLPDGALLLSDGSGVALVDESACIVPPASQKSVPSGSLNPVPFSGIVGPSCFVAPSHLPVLFD